MSDISVILENAILSPDPVKRNEAEAQLKSLSEENFLMYIGLLTQTLADESIKPEVRILAGIQLKNQLTSKDQQKKKHQAERWISLDQNSKSQIKEISLKALLSPIDRVANSAAQLVAAIADIELPRQEWNDLIGIIVENTKPEKPEHVKRASLLAIGYICETSDPNDAGVVSQSNGILIAIVQGAQSSETSKTVRLTALNALVDSLEFIKFNFEREGERNYIMQVVCEATQADDDDLQAAAFGALARIMSLYYSHMSVYMEKALYGLTVAGMQNKNEQVACMAVEFWSTVCENEIEIALEKEEFPDSPLNSYNFAIVALQDILPTLFQLLTRQNEDLDDDSWNVSMAAGACLQLFAQDTGNYVVQPTLQFVEANISSPEWRNREAAVMAFGSILDGPDREQLKVLIGQALIPILNLIHDENLQVKDTVAWCIGRIADLIIDAIDIDQHLPIVIQTIIKGLQDHGKVSTNSCWTLINIVEKLNQSAQHDETSPLSKYYSNLVPILIQVSGRGDNEYSARASAYEALSTLVLFSANDVMPIVNNIAQEVLTRIEQTVQLQSQLVSNEDKSNLEELQSNILNLLTNIIRRVGSEVAPVSDNLMELFLKLLQAQQQNSSIEEDVFIAISALAGSVGQDFNKYMTAFLPFLTNALNQTESPVSNTAVGLVADISHSLGENFIQYSEGLLNILGSIVSNNNVRKELKPFVLSSFGDIASAINSQFKPYLQVVFEICHGAQNSQPENSSIEALDYVLNVRESVLDCYVGIVGGLHEEADALFPFVQQIFELLATINEDPALTLSESVSKSAVGLIGDLAQIFADGRIKTAYNQDWITQLIKKTRNNPSFQQNTKDTARWAREQQKQQINL
ncbi:Importin subunit beta-1 [Wickerhamomyces ciferrii]|uniref:Importin-95 n=1 Tax=Wickerhamomyces ciferrii (strain ATCC 14091 / BCRC 22168 / CBS 111 / JCM 3599 / NBRC 0793 / NRRL Y-1031 F-60-10) TaxID=1206466 RepID=K0KVV1_WICCF|nr:Importin subunit beta-1 [Wickerhamomyces ciferrii]CCH45624.1 Importin subunit beta-1 [Wickerhamomyces ciferrii]